MLKELKKFLEFGQSLMNPKMWKSLDIDYLPPRVERLYMTMNGYRYYLHVIHPTDELCFLHKHRYPSAVYIMDGAYEMGVAYSEKDVFAEEAYDLPIVSKMIMTRGSSYEMTERDGLHYVKPLQRHVLSVMVTKEVYPNPPKEQLNKVLQELSDERKNVIIGMFENVWPQGRIPYL